MTDRGPKLSQLPDGGRDPRKGRSSTYAAAYSAAYGRPGAAFDGRRCSATRGLRGHAARFVDSFRREDGTSANNLGSADFQMTDLPSALDDGFGDAHMTRDRRGERYYDIRSANARTASSLLSRELKGRHLQMIAIGGSIGTGLFVASGKTLSQGGPASVLLAYLFIGVMLYCTVQALGEMAVVFPVAGSFSAFSTRFLDPSWGFAMGWK